MRINEIFFSIQGESSFSGYPCVFVRCAGCNLKCSYCDTEYARREGAAFTLSRLLEKIDFYGFPRVEITGGEPLLQDETPQLITSLLDRGYEVLLETNGSRDIAPVDTRCVRVVDIKCPGSGEQGSFLESNINFLTPADEIKFVIGSRDDYRYACSALERLRRRSVQSRVHFSPVFSRLSAADLAEWVLQDRIDVHLGLQLHKYIWGEDARGV